jgi:DNA repair protein RadD
MSSEVQLRLYQETDLGKVRVFLRQHRSVLLVQPTGAGKGTLATHVVNTAVSRGYRVLFLVNRRTLVRDMSHRLDKLGIDHGIIMGDDPRRRPELSTHIASIDTLHRREEIPEAHLLILDEAHFCVTDTWSRVIARYPEAKILGMTATPTRLDGRGLGELFNVMVQGPQVQELIQMKHLVPSRLIQPPGGPNVSGVRMVAGEFNNRALAEVCDVKTVVGNVVEHWKKYASDRKTVSFGVNRRHAQHIAEEFRCQGIDCAYVDGETPDDERDRVWHDLDHGGLRVVSSVGIVSYGWDHPVVSCVVGARPTASLGLWLQQVGRGSRPHPESGKSDLLILDHAGNTQRLDVLYEDDRNWSLDGKALKEKSRSQPVTTCRECFASFASGPHYCPYCGAALQKGKPREIRHVAGELEEYKRKRKVLSAQEWRDTMNEEARKKKYEEFQRIARERGYSPKWPAVKFKVIFGTWPPRKWGITAR